MPVDENVLLVVAKITRIGEQQPERLGDLVLAVRRVGARVGAVGEGLRRDVKDDSLISDHRVPVDCDIQVDHPRTIVRQEEQKVTTRTTECDGFADSDIRRGFELVDQARAPDGIHERNRGVVKKRRVPAIRLQHHVIEAKTGLEGDDVLHHAEVIVG